MRAEAYNKLSRRPSRCGGPIRFDQAWRLTIMNEVWKKAIKAGLILLSVLASIKICFLGLGIDEEYAVTMSYRMVSGDRMFLEMWEPHQTSGFLSAALIRLFILLTGRTDYMILYLRICGCLIQLLIGLFLYFTTKRYFSDDICFLATVFFCNTLPKWIQMPEFSNMLIWFSVLCFLCLLRYYVPVSGKTTGSCLWLILAGLSLSGLILSYPSCILSVPVLLIAMWKIQSRRSGRVYLRQAGILLGTCAVSGALYVAYFLSHMSLGDFFYGVLQMMRDGSHNETVGAKILTWGQELLHLCPAVLLCLGITGLLCLCLKRLRSLSAFLTALLCVTLLQQVVIWLGDSRYLQNPLVYFYVLFVAGFLVHEHYFRDKNTVETFLFWAGTVFGGAVWLSALLITNTTISVTGPYLMTGLLSAIFLLARSFMEESVSCEKPKSTLGIVGCVCLIGVTLFAKGYLVCSNEGVKDTVFMVRQKVLYGPAKGIYCRYVEGYTLNRYAEILENVSVEGKKVLYMGGHSLIYLYGDQTICNYSTISTATFDDRLLEYWNRNTEKRPELVICDMGEEQIKKMSNLLTFDQLLVEETILENIPEFKIYQVFKTEELDERN